MATYARADSATDRIAAQWCALFAANGLYRHGTMVEVGPGFAPKLGIALRAYNFRGSLFVVEPHPEASASILEHYARLLPGCEVVAVQSSIRDAAHAIPRNVDAVVMNHMLDDLLLNAMIAETERTFIFGGMRPGVPCSPDVRAAWRRVAEDVLAFGHAATAVLDEVCAFCTAVTPGWIAASQYVSWVHAHERLEFVDRLTAPLLEQLARRLEASGSYPEISLAPDRRWFVARAVAQEAAAHSPRQAITA